MINQTFGKLTVIASAPKTDRHLKWECLCACGNTTVVRSSNLTGRHTISCGCAQKESVTTHGGRKTRLYQTWTNMRRRCTDPKSKDYKNYGALGITYIPGWDDFSTFQTWAHNTGYKDHLTLDRKRVEGNYEPDNCQWSDWSTQASNQRKEPNKSSKYLGVTQRRNRWEASIKRFKETHCIGVYDTEIEAAQARDNYVKAMQWPHKLNF